MTVRPYVDLLSTAANLVRIANEKGLSTFKPIRIPILGSSIQSDLLCPERMFTISYGIPPVPKYDIEIWVNPLSRQVFRSNPYTVKWDLVINYVDMFLNPEVNGGSGGSSGAVDAPVATTGDLLAMNTTNIPDRTMIYVEAEKAIYALDTQSIEPTSPGVLAPAVGPGRWYVISTASGTLGNVDGGVF